MFFTLCKNDTVLVNNCQPSCGCDANCQSVSTGVLTKGCVFKTLLTAAVRARPLHSEHGETNIVQKRKEDGFTLLEVLFVCGLIGVLSAMALPRLLMAKQAADASSAIGSLRAINSSELAYASSCDGGFYSPNLTTLGVTPPGSNVPFISPDLSIANTVNKSGYIIQLSATAFAAAPVSCNGLAAGAGARGFKAGADPVVPSNNRFFATNADNTIYEEISTLFAVMPETGIPPAGHALQ